MGKWCRVKCPCHNRIPLPGSHRFYYSEYCLYEKEPRLAKSPEEFEDKVKGMYECGHRDGVLVQFPPNDLFTISDALDQAYEKQSEHFQLFRRIGQPQNYRDELLLLASGEAIIWQIEIEQLQIYLDRKKFIEWDERKKFWRYLADNYYFRGPAEKTLEDGLLLCEASIKTGNPVEFLW